MNHIQHCITCEQVKHPAGNHCYPLQNIENIIFKYLVQFDYLKICKSKSGNTGLLVIFDHFTKLAKSTSSAHEDDDAQTTVPILLNKLPARPITSSKMQSDNAKSFTAELAQEMMKVTSTPSHPLGNGPV